MIKFIDNGTTGVVKNESCRISKIEFFGYFYVQTFICFFGFWMNLFCLIVFQKRQFHRVVHYFMTALAFFDLLTLLIVMPQGLVRCSESTNQYLSYCQTKGFKLIRLGIYKFSIYFGFPVSNITEMMSILIVLMLAWERYNFMIGSTQYKCQPSTYVYTILSVLFCICIISNLPFFFVQDIIEINYTALKPNENQNGSHYSNYTKLKTIFTDFGESNIYKSYLWFRMVIIPILILLIMTILSILLIKVTHQSFKNYCMAIKSQTEVNTTLINNNHSVNVNIFTRRQEIELQLTLLLILLILLFIIGQFPQAFSFKQLYEKITPKHDPPINIECRYDFKVYKLVAYILSLCTYGFQFFIYLLFDGTFRKLLFDLFKCKKSNHDDNIDPLESQETFNFTTIRMKDLSNSLKENLTSSGS